MTNKYFTNSTLFYICPWLIMLVFCILVLAMLSMVYDSDKMSQIWWTVPVGGAFAAVVCNLFELYLSKHCKK